VADYRTDFLQVWILGGELSAGTLAAAIAPL
jgi:hypothetical protein